MIRVEGQAIALVELFAAVTRVERARGELREATRIAVGARVDPAQIAQVLGEDEDAIRVRFRLGPPDDLGPA